MIAEAKGKVASRLARAEAELEVQRARIAQVRSQLQADVLEPARAQKAAAEASARGDAAQIVEQGRATAQAMEQIAATWSRVGAGAREVFLMQKMDELIRIVMGTVRDLKVERLTVLGGVGAGTPANGAPLASGRPGRRGRPDHQHQRAAQGRRRRGYSGRRRGPPRRQPPTRQDRAGSRSPAHARAPCSPSPPRAGWPLRA